MVAHTPQAPLGLTTGRRFRLAAREIVGTAAIMVAYFYLRGIRPDNAESSVSRSLRLIQFEQSIGVFQEVRWQAAFLGHGWLMDIANVVYAWGHYPVMLAIALWLVFKDPVKFRFVRNVLLVSATIGIISYWLIPAAPPRLMEHYGYDFGFIDTVHGATSNVSYFQPGPFVNDYAALPSFHFGWILLSTMAIWSNTSNRYVRGGAVAHISSWQHNWWTSGCGDTGGGNCSTCGVGVTIEDEQGVRWTYCHGTNVTVALNDAVSAGTQIMWSGNTGRSGAPHVHLEIRVDGEKRCPQTLLRTLWASGDGVSPSALPQAGCF